MKHSTFLLSLPFALIGPGQAALADVTADQVWQNWKDIAAASGQSYAPASEQLSGATLTLTDLKLTALDGAVRAEGTIPLVTFTENGDGTVSITVSDEYRLQMQATRPDGKATSNTLIVGQSGADIRASGTPEAISYDYKANSVTLNALDFVIDGTPREMDFDLSLNDPQITYAVSADAVMMLTTTMAAQSLALRAVGTAPGAAGQYEVTAQVNGLAGASSTALAPGGMAGLANDAAFTFNDSFVAVSNTTKEGAQSQFDTASAGGTVNISTDRVRLAYGFGVRGVTMRGTGAGLPMGLPEVGAAYDEASAEVLIPLAKADTPQPFSLNLRLKGLTLSEQVWAGVDANATLPRAPATLVIETAGTMQPLVDLTSGAALRGQVPPVQVQSLDVKALELSAAGALVKGTGALTFDNSQPPVLMGLAPMPQGQISLSADGVNGLLGNLAALGVINPQLVQTFGALSQVLALPGPNGPDSLTSVIGFTARGITANGIPLPF